MFPEDPNPAPPPPPPSPAEFVEAARAVLTVQTSLSPRVEIGGLTGLDTWLWCEDPGVLEVGVALRGWTATATMQAVQHAWAISGTASAGFTSSSCGSEGSPAASWMPETKGPYSVTLTSTWAGDWTLAYNGFPAGTFPLGPFDFAAPTVPYPVDEYRGRLTSPEGEEHVTVTVVDQRVRRQCRQHRCSRWERCCRWCSWRPARKPEWCWRGWCRWCGQQWSDARASRLPDRVVLPGLAVFAAVLVASVPLIGSSSLLVSGLVGAAVLFVPLGLVHLVSPEGLGFGDVKYGALIGAGVGAATRPGAVVLVFALAMVVQVVVVWLRPLPAQRVPGADRRAAPLGPAMALAAVVWVVVSLILEGGV